MSQPIAKYSQPESLTSPLLLAPPDAVPSVDDLERIEQELKLFKQRSLERGKKADDDLRILESAMRKMKELEKGKAKALAKVKREPSYTPSLDTETHSSPLLPSTSNHVSVNGSSVITSGSPVPRNLLEAKKMKKKDKDKKRKRDVDESDGEHDSQRPRKFSPHPPSHKESHPYKPSKLSTVSHQKAPAGPDWSLPSPHPLLQNRPPIPPPVPPGPRRPVEVTEDFSKAKAPGQQVTVQTFYTSIEPWLRPIKEEDIGWLEFTADEVEPYIMPKLGRHYTEQWEDEDIAMYGGVPTALDFSNARGHSSANTSHGPIQKWDASTIVEDDLVREKGFGPVTERLVTALLPATDPAKMKSVKEAEDAYEARMVASGSGASSSSHSKERVFVPEFEERIKDTARFYGLLDGEPDFSDVADDPISTALRKAQRQLRVVAETNKARKARLAEIARDRLAYQEYIDVRDSIDKSIASTYTKLQKKDGPKMPKKKKKGEVNGGVNGLNGLGGPPAPLPNPASLGLGPDDEGNLVVPDTLKALVDTRREWVNVMGGAFEDRERENPGWTHGLPSRSVFEGVDDEVRQKLHRRTEGHAGGRAGNGQLATTNGNGPIANGFP